MILTEDEIDEQLEEYEDYMKQNKENSIIKINKEEYILDEEKYNMMNRKERREFLKEHKKNKKRLKF